ncbi:MAG: helix-turn-helix transcriptional regulator [Candidatus Tectomicrobia bacterium]|uniref:Helix-turn-helix transcriptional regulator n=1 Tax=Tectimicrobiota bacterium TaxID=2528274 RepID=A0A938B1C6_UNCTE|nr:helix-turn-helix transcriptional regulator [Candidatus Tectomicrobia bacterium]
MSLAKKIVQLRKERNLTQKELARIVGVHFSHMSRYERGLSLPSIDVIKKLAQMFHVSADYLLFDDAQAMVRGNIADQELLQQFERLSRMSEREKNAVKTILEAVILKHHLEDILGVKHASPTADGEPARPDTTAGWHGKPAEADLFQDLEAAFDHAKRPGLPRRRSTQRV